MNKVHIEVYGAGSEIGHVAVSKEAFEFWKDQSEDDVASYMYAWDDDIYDELDFDIPEQVDFLKDPEYGKMPWHDSPDLLDQKWLISHDNGKIDIEVNNVSIFDDDDSQYTDDVIIGDDCDDEETEIRVQGTWDSEMQKKFTEAKYIITYESVEKGGFMDFTFNIDGDFDKSKLMFTTEEEWYSGSDMLVSAEYDGEELDNVGGDSNGKGIYGYVWKWGE